VRQRLVVAAVLFLALVPLHAATDPTYGALRAARPDGRSIALTNFTFDRDVYHFILNGALHLLAPVNGTTVGAIFVGEGEYTLTPATPDDRRALALNAADPKLTNLSDKFDSAVFFDAALVKQAGAAKTGSVDPRANQTFDDFLKRERKDFTTNFHLRVLQDLLDPTDPPLFFAFVRGRKLPPAVLAVDPRGADALRLFDVGDDNEGSLLFVQDRARGGVWYLSHSKQDYQRGSATVVAHVADADRYQIDTTIAPNAEVSGTTVMMFTCMKAGRVLPIALARKLRIDDVQFSPANNAPSWTAVPFVQENADEDADVAVIFPSALQVGSHYLLKTKYHGVGKEVLTDAGDGNYIVGARESWYPNVGSFRDTADYELTFRIPQKSRNQVVAVGVLTDDKIEGDQHVTVWKSTHPLRVAGFNYGNFKKTSTVDSDSGMTIEVYTNPGEPDIIRQINMATEAAPPDALFGSELAGGVHIDTSRLAQAAFADGANTSRVGNLFFGPLPDKRLAITQQSAWFYGQSWPNLVYLPYLAFVGSYVRHQLGFGLDIADFVDQVGAHEVAHQWWGHLVGGRSYHDAWLSEGFAEFTSGLVLELRSGVGATNAFYEKKRHNILETMRGAHISNDEAGPIIDGFRLSTWQAPAAYNVIVYDKGAYVLHMLRMLFHDARKQSPEEDFIAMMHDFASTYAGKNASTEDFQHIVEKHAPRKMKVTTDGTLNWFFDQWVRGMAIPRYVSKLDVQLSAGGKYRISGSVTQSEVPDSFVGIMPLYVTFDNSAMAKLGDLLLIGNATKNINVEIPLSRQPKGVSINAMHDVLAR
jgi:hypothetical protein